MKPLTGFTGQVIGQPNNPTVRPRLLNRSQSVGTRHVVGGVIETRDAVLLRPDARRDRRPGGLRAEVLVARDAGRAQRARQPREISDASAGSLPPASNGSISRHVAPEIPKTKTRDGPSRESPTAGLLLLELIDQCRRSTTFHRLAVVTRQTAARALIVMD